MGYGRQQIGRHLELEKEPIYAVVVLDQAGRPNTQLSGQADVGGLRSENRELGLLLHYHVPPQFQSSAAPGHLVLVPLRGKPTYGVIVEIAGSSPAQPTLPIWRIVDSSPVLSPAMLSLAQWISRYYRCTLWQAIAPMLPPGVARRAITTVGLSTTAASGGEGRGEYREDGGLIAALGRRQQQVVLLLDAAPRNTLTLSKLKRRYRGAASGLDAALRGLERDGLVTRRTELPSPRSRPQQERIIRLAVSQDAAADALRAAAERAPIQAAALDWLLKRISSQPLKSNWAGNGGHNSLAGAKTPLPDDEAARGEEPGWLLLRDLYLHTGATSSTVAALERKGLVELSERMVYRKAVPPTASSPNDEPPALTSAQSVAWRAVAAALRQLGSNVDEPTRAEASTATSVFLLHGVTGSGKTEIYLRAIGMALRMGKQALVLVPEISLTPQAVHRFASRFPGRVALIHSQLSAGQQFDEWRRIHAGQADIVVGSRSAVFAPLPRLGLVVVDEEHEWAYKQQDHSPRYHARDVALQRATIAGAVVILGSATPDLATYYRAQKGEYSLLSLPTRVGRRRARDGSELITELPMPPVQVVDMRAELRSGNNSLFSRTLQSLLDTTLARGEQAILYLNRRGSSSFLLCRECGYVPMCHRCDVPLVYHADIYGLLCHRCNAYSLTMRHCPKCGGAIRGFGVGTQKVVDEVAQHFPRARVLRWDRDTASRQGGHTDMMEMFTRGEADVLVGTQMIAKGLDIARVTLVGVVSADTGLFLPDFRAPERSLQLLMQVAGRAGRRTESRHSRVIVQTFNPEHYAIEAASRHDYRGFYDGEIHFRAEHGYPPYGQLARLVYTSASDERCEQEASIVARHLRHRAEQLTESDRSSYGAVDVLGPVPCFTHKVRGRYRWQVLIRADDVAPLLEGFYPGPGWSLDVDPMSLL